MINPLFLPQNSPYRKKTISKSSKIIQNIVNQHRQLKVIHQLDCIYQGEINQSYKFQGFGLLQTHNFQLYLGFWKGSKINGVGMIIYPEGYRLYGNFKDNQLQGIVIIDNKVKLKVINYHNNKIIGVGYQYNYQQTKWELVKYHQGLSIQTLSSIVQPLQNGLPSMFNINEDMYLFLMKYLKQQYFNCPHKNILEKMNVHNLQNDLIYFGQMVDGKQWGIGLIYNKNKGLVIQTGFYENNQFNGYALQINHQKNKIQIGPYVKGKKDGFFYQKVDHLQFIVQYQKNYSRGERPELNKTKISHNQKIYNYQKNDYLSEKNKIRFKQYLGFFDQRSKSILLQKKYGKKQQEANNKKKLDHSKQNVVKVSKIPTNLLSNKIISPNNTKQIIPHQLSTVQYIREKFSNIDKIIKKNKISFDHQKQKNQMSNVNIKVSSKMNKKNQDIFDDNSIQSEDKPVAKEQKKRYPYAQKYNLFDKFSPYRSRKKSQRRIFSPSKSQKRNKLNYQSPEKISLSPAIRKTSPRRKKPIFD